MFLFITFKATNLNRAWDSVATFFNTGNVITMRNNYTCIIVYYSGGLHELLPNYKAFAPQ